MKLQRASFTFKHHEHGAITVEFAGDIVFVTRGDLSQKLRIDNKSARYGGRPFKPCATHAIDLARQVLPKPEAPKTEFDKQRRAKQRPGLRIHRGQT